MSSRLKIGCLCLSTLGLFAGCKATKSESSETLGYRDSGFLSRLYLKPGLRLQSQMASLKNDGGFPMSWEDLPDGVKEVDISEVFSKRFETDSQLNDVWFDGKWFLSPASATVIEVEPSKLRVRMGKTTREVPVNTSGPRPYVEFDALRTALSRCPFDADTLRKSPLVAWTSQAAQLDASHLSIKSENSYFTAVHWSRSGVRLQGNCELTLHDGRKAVQLAVNTTVTINFSEEVFDLPAEDPRQAMAFPVNDLGPFSHAGRQVLAANLTTSPDAKTVVVSRLDISKKVGIDDLQDAAGQPLSGAPGSFLQKTLRQLLKQLREEIPELGQQLVLRSEDPSIAPTIAFRLDPNLEHPGVAGCAESDISGMAFACQVVLWLGGTQLQPFAKAMKDIGLISDIEREVALVDKAVVTHEFGHALGLIHNFAGVYLDSKGLPVVTSVMGYPFGLPFQVIDYDAKFYAHDILSLKFIYADFLAKDSKQLQAKLLPELGRYPLIADGADGPENLTQTAKKFKFMQRLNNPAFQKIKAKDPAILDKIDKVYKEYLNVQ